jgi:hypothetical protein
LVAEQRDGRRHRDGEQQGRETKGRKGKTEKKHRDTRKGRKASRKNHYCLSPGCLRAGWIDGSMVVCVGANVDKERDNIAWPRWCNDVARNERAEEMKLMGDGRWGENLAQ